MLKTSLGALATLFSLHAWAASDAQPMPPCDGAAPAPAFSPAGDDPAMETWSSIDWPAPACLGWSASHYRFVIAVAGRVDAAGGEELRRRLGAISAMKGLRYWSVTESATRVLIKDAAAVSGSDGARRDDFTAADIRTGAVLHFVEEDNRSSEPVTYRMRILESTADRIVADTENVTPVKAFVTLFPPGTFRAAYVMTRIDERTWGLYAISAATDKASGMVSLGKESYANRARALFGYFAGKPL
ncbi:MAG TPA: DUF6675 family protein [Usitatibacter sp.]|nr:DUF6675 family protein [Usitatibacter sp.]